MTSDRDILSYDPFQGDRDCNIHLLSDKMIVTRREHDCFICWGPIAKGERCRARTEIDRDDDVVATFRFCATCCEAMAKAVSDPDDAGRAIEDRTGMGMRASGQLPGPPPAEGRS